MDHAPSKPEPEEGPDAGPLVKAVHVVVLKDLLGRHGTRGIVVVRRSAAKLRGGHIVVVICGQPEIRVLELSSGEEGGGRRC